MADRHIRFSVSIPADRGYVGRACNDPNCGCYFKVHENSWSSEMFCPYCGGKFSRNELLTKAQADLVERATAEKAKKLVLDQIDKMFGKMARSFRGNKFVSFKHTPIRYKERPVVPSYREKEVDSELKCPACGCMFQVYGIFGFCPSCRSENLQIYDANLKIIEQELQHGRDKTRTLRHAYADFVSTFESFCERKAASFTDETTNFQDLFGTRRFFKKHTTVDILAGISPGDILTLKRVFSKRHAYQHSGGKITERYVRKVPEDRELLGLQAELSQSEFTEGANLLREVLGRVAEACDPRGLKDG